MTNDLFPDCKQDSPRLSWELRHGVNVRPATKRELMSIEDSELDKSAFVASCCAPTHPYAWAHGPTEDEAIAALAGKLGIPLWHEEAYAAERRAK